MPRAGWIWTCSRDDTHVHDHLQVDQERVAAAVPLAIDLYGAYVRRVAGFLRSAT